MPRAADEITKCDLLVIGAGAAGCRAAIAASDRKANVILCCKGAFGKCGSTNLAGALYAAAFGELDSPRIHFEDTVRGGGYIGDQQLARVLAEQAPETVHELQEWGVPWVVRDGKLIRNPAPGHRFPRAVNCGGATGRAIQRALVREVLRPTRHPPIRVLDDCLVTRLLTVGNAAAGAVLLDLRTGRLVVIRAPAIVIATGGAGQLYRFTDTETGSTGDGIALGYLAGCELIAPEMHQFFPTGLCYPPSLSGISLPTSTLWARGAELLNSQRERFTARYYPDRLENVSREELSRAICTEVLAGRGTPHGGVWLDATKVHSWQSVKTHLSRAFVWPERAFGMKMDFVEVAPTYHFTIGGLRIDPDTGTSVRGIYSAGEAAGGLHGANRLGGNALPECLVFGRIAGVSAAKYAAANTAPALPMWQVEGERTRVSKLLEAKRKGSRAIALKKRLRDAMWKYAGIVRDQDGLQEGLRVLNTLKEQSESLVVKDDSLVYNLEIVDAIELTNMLILAKVFAKAALFRTESRGAHFRQDYPRPDDQNWLKNVVAKHTDGTDELTAQPVAFPLPKPGEVTA